MSKSHKKTKRLDDFDDRSHHTFKQIKNMVNKKQIKKLDRQLTKVSKNHKHYLDLEEYA